MLAFLSQGGPWIILGGTYPPLISPAVGGQGNAIFRLYPSFSIAVERGIPQPFPRGRYVSCLGYKQTSALSRGSWRGGFVPQGYGYRATVLEYIAPAETTRPIVTAQILNRVVSILKVDYGKFLHPPPLDRIIREDASFKIPLVYFDHRGVSLSPASVCLLKSLESIPIGIVIRKPTLKRCYLSVHLMSFFPRMRQLPFRYY